MRTFKILWITISLSLLLLVSCLKSSGGNLDDVKLQGQWLYSKYQKLVLFDLHNKIEQLVYTTKGAPEGMDYFDLSPDDKTIIFSVSNVIEGEKLVRMKKDGDSPQTLIDYAHGEPYRGISWSPDGRKIAIVRGKYDDRKMLFNLYVMSPQGKDAQIISDVNPELGKPSWSPDSKKIIFAGYGSRVGVMKEDEKISKKGTAALNIGIFMVDIENGVTNKIIDSGFSPAWSPDGQSIAYYEPDAYSKKAKLKLFNIKNKTIITILQTGWIGDSLAWSPDGKYILYPRFKKFSMGRQVLEVYSLDQKKNFRITETESINDLVWR